MTLTELLKWMNDCDSATLTVDSRAYMATTVRLDWTKAGEKWEAHCNVPSSEIESQGCDVLEHALDGLMQVIGRSQSAKPFGPSCAIDENGVVSKRPK